jgi:uncharacterized protein YecT (DUF1311 family)
MVQRPPYDRGNMPPGPPPGGFDPRFGGRHEAGQRFDDGPGPDPRYDPRDTRAGFDPRDPRAERDPRFDGPDPFDRGSPPPPPSGRGPGPARSNRWLWILGGLLLLGAILFGLSLTRTGPGSDALDKDSGESKEEAAAADPEARCAAPATYDLIKRELFRQAAATRGSNQGVFTQLPSYATLRVTNPVLSEQEEGLERVSCTGNASLDLPPGLAVAGGRRTLTANIGYNLQPAADNSGEVVTLTGAEGIVIPLSTLARVGVAGSSPSEVGPVPGDQQAPGPGDVPAAPQPSAPPPEAARPADAAPDRVPPPPATVRPTASVRPSFNCARARTRGEIAVCRSSELAALDRQMANFYQTSYRGAEPEARALLERTRGRFLGFRDRCRTDACIADSYRGRITEIRDIVDGRWRPN